jgi:hypothetical protein
LLANGVETVEGWAHYCEEMMAEKGFTADRETKLIQVNDVIWRAVRIIVDVKLSRGEMTFDDAVRMLAGKTLDSRVEERSEGENGQHVQREILPRHPDCQWLLAIVLGSESFQPEARTSENLELGALVSHSSFSVSSFFYLSACSCVLDEETHVTYSF